MPEENFNQEEDHSQHQPEGVHEETPQKEESGKINAIAILSYLWLLFLVPLLGAKDDAFAQFHAKQGLTLFGLWLVGFIIALIPVLGWIISFIINIVILVFAIMGIINVVKGKKEELPVIGQYADKFNI